MAERGLIGVQMSTIAPVLRTGEVSVYDAFAKIAEVGYHCVEISQVDMSAENVASMKKACEDFGVKVSSCTASVEPMFEGMPGENLRDDFDKIVNDCRELGTDMLRIGMLPMTLMGSRDGAIEFVKRADEMAERLGEEGIDLYYHNHHVEFVQYDGEYLLDIIKNTTKKMGFELDIHWIQRGGENPVNFIKSYAGRIRLLHLKDYRIAPFEMPEQGEDFMEKFGKAFSDVIKFAEVGEGSLPIKDCIDAGLAGGSEYFLVEQDDCYGRDPFESLKISHDNLIELGYGDWFEL